ncbi:replication initiation and membrane attachment family protein [Bacillus benzoevorans]|uniref:Replication initiation and membrane attachment protein n=1 Tax=Bacillus benzoevorans TaxID=1456 RepID=A0A7X0LVM4_9BACI|nr:DnaD domain protein [Bacillus benzoevorans]MBB6445675.1 replication initiation and membrane attachment protein [Bacillus benzoevorans]
MTQHWQELLPIDRYVVTANGLLHDYDRKVLTFLYQPLIGAMTLSLYLTLWAELEENRLWSESHSHHSLMNFMDMNLQAIYNSRLKLEGIGLLKTYVKEDEDIRSFVYELQPPLTPEQFLLDGMLNIYLYRKIGKAQFARVKRFFSDQTMQDSDYKQVTKAFQDVFTSFHPSAFSYSDEMKQDIEMEQEYSYIGRQHPKNIKAEAPDFNFDLLFAGLHENLISGSAFTEPVREVISNLAFLYGIDPIQMKNIVISAIDEDNKINLEELRKSARDWYQFEHYDQLPSLIERTQPVIHQSSKQEPETQEDKLIRYFDTTSPLQFLKDISGGAEPAKAEMKIIEDVMFGQKLNPGVVNVLIDNVLRIADKKLPRGLVEVIAGEWVRNEIKTVKEAMELAKKNRRQYIERAKEKKTTKSGNYKKKPIRTEVLPDWFDKEDKNEAKEKSVAAKTAEEIEKDNREIEEMLKKLRS